MGTLRLLLPGLACMTLLLPGYPAAAAKKPQPAPAAAQTALDPGPAKSLGAAGSWTAYLAQNRAGKVCYVVGQPERADPAAPKGKSVMAMITHRTQDAVSNVVSFDTGVPLNEEDEVTLDVGGAKFALFAKDDTAWARTADLDKAIVIALAREKQAVVKATPKKGRAAVDTYSLSGLSKVLGLIDKACGVKR